MDDHRAVDGHLHAGAGLHDCQRGYPDDLRKPGRLQLSGNLVITSFGVANAISIPITGWLAKRFGEVRLFLWSTGLFALTSWLCGVSQSLEMLILFRVLQGLVAGPLIPLSQSLLLGNYPPPNAIWRWPSGR